MTGGRISRPALALVSMAVAALMAAQPLSAASLTSVVEDPTGDAFLWYPPGPAPGYLDIVGASITLKDGRFILVLDVAESIPTSPALPTGTHLLEWAWDLDTNPATFPAGFPFAGRLAGDEYIVQILWDGTNFMGQLIDRTPLVTGGEAVVTRLSFSIKGAEFSTSVEATMVGSPSSFFWNSATRTWATELGTFAWFPVDHAPNCCGPASWPS